MNTLLIDPAWLCQTFNLKPHEADDFLERKGPEIKQRLLKLEDLVDEYTQEFIERRMA